MGFGIQELAAVLGGFVLLVWAADRFVLGAAGLARILGVSPLIIGLVVVGFGTSAPEMLVSALAAWEGNPGLAVGNAVGSNITNVGLVLGVTVLVAPLSIHSDLLRREFPLLMALMAVVFLFFLDGDLNRWEGVLLLAGLVGFVYWMVRIARLSRRSDPLAAEVIEELPEALGLGMAIFWTVAGLLVLMLGAKFVVWGAVAIAQAFGISDLVIGLTIVAIGTSLPELAASVMSARKNEHDLAIGNVIGSNMFNLLGVLGLPAVIAPAALDGDLIYRDFPAMALLTVLLYFMAKGLHGKPGHVTRLEGGVLLSLYAGYMVILYLSVMASR